MRGWSAGIVPFTSLSSSILLVLQDARYPFDRVLDAEVTQQELYAEVEQLCLSVLDGNSVCVFAYGQTGSGKTYTMEGHRGDAEGEGIVFRAMRQLCKAAEEQAKKEAAAVLSPASKQGQKQKARIGGVSGGAGWAIALSMYEIHSTIIKNASIYTDFVGIICNIHWYFHTSLPPLQVPQDTRLMVFDR